MRLAGMQGPWARILVLAIGCCSVAQAVDLRAARDHYKKATHAFNSGAYNLAADEYTLAYQASDDPLLLYNIAVSFRRAHHVPQAVRAYRMYLKRLPHPDNRAECETAIHELLMPAPSPSPAPPAATAAAADKAAPPR
jgi:hypothetical protein